MLRAVCLREGGRQRAIPPSLTMNNNLYLHVIKGDKRCPRGHASPSLSKATIAQKMCRHMRRNRLFTHQSRTHNGHWFEKDMERAHFTLSITHSITVLSTWLDANAAHFMLCSQLLQRGHRAPLASVVGNRCSHRLPDTLQDTLQRLAQAQKDVYAYAFSLTHVCQRIFYKHHTNKCAQKTFYKIRTAQTSETQSQLCTLPHPIWDWVLTSNTQSLCCACTNCVTMFKDTAWDKQQHANSSAQKWPCRVFVCLMDHLSSLVIVLHHKRHIIHDGTHGAGNMEHMSRLVIEGLSFQAKKTSVFSSGSVTSEELGRRKSKLQEKAARKRITGEDTALLKKMVLYSTVALCCGIPTFQTASEYKKV